MSNGTNILDIEEPDYVESEFTGDLVQEQEFPESDEDVVAAESPYGATSTAAGIPSFIGGQTYGGRNFGRRGVASAVRSRGAAARNLITDAGVVHAAEYHFSNKSTEEAGDSIILWLLGQGVLTYAGVPRSAGEGAMPFGLGQILNANVANQLNTGLLTRSQAGQQVETYAMGDQQWDSLGFWFQENWDQDPVLSKKIHEALRDVPNVTTLMNNFRNARTSEEQDAALKALRRNGLVSADNQFLGTTDSEMQAKLDNEIIPTIIDEHVAGLRRNSLFAADVSMRSADGTTIGQPQHFIVSFDGSPYDITSIDELFGYGAISPLNAAEYITNLNQRAPDVIPWVEAELYALGLIDERSNGTDIASIQQGFAKLQTQMLNDALVTGETDPDKLYNNLIERRVETFEGFRDEGDEPIGSETADKINANVVRALQSRGYDFQNFSVEDQNALFNAVEEAVNESLSGGTPGYDEYDTFLAETLLSEFFDQGLTAGEMDVEGITSWTDSLSFYDNNTTAAFVDLALRSGSISKNRAKGLTGNPSKWKGTFTEEEIKNIAVANMVNTFSGQAGSMTADQIEDALYSFATLMGQTQHYNRGYYSVDYQSMANNAYSAMQKFVPQQDASSIAEDILDQSGVDVSINTKMSAALDSIAASNYNNGMRRSRIQNV